CERGDPKGPWQWSSYSTIIAEVSQGHPLVEYPGETPSFAQIAWIANGPHQHRHGDQLRVPEGLAHAELIVHMLELTSTRSLFEGGRLQGENAMLREVAQSVARDGSTLCAVERDLAGQP